jgi:mannose-6-phosphate isomerase-like protein (cupin superfamily)
VIQQGQTVENPVTGERMTFIETSKSTGGEYVLIELRADAPAGSVAGKAGDARPRKQGGAVAAAHVHPSQWERFEVVSGRLGAKVGGRKVEAGPGEVVGIAPGTAHTWWNAGDDELVFRCEVRPALQFESLIETMFSLAADGKTNKKGMPNPLRLAVIANAHFDTVRLPKIPSWMQKAALMMGAPVGKAMGYGSTYKPEQPQRSEQLVPRTA